VTRKRIAHNKEVAQLIRELRRRGWEVTPTNGDHWKARLGEHCVFFASSPSDRRSLRNTRARIARVERAALRGT
jgi:hypothetical protein